jgi:hypothetical protein
MLYLSQKKKDTSQIDVLKRRSIREQVRTDKLCQERSHGSAYIRHVWLLAGRVKLKLDVSIRKYGLRSKPCPCKRRGRAREAADFHARIIVVQQRLNVLGVVYVIVGCHCE